MPNDIFHFASKKGKDKSAHMHRLVTALIIRSLEIIIITKFGACVISERGFSSALIANKGS